MKAPGHHPIVRSQASGRVIDVDLLDSVEVFLELPEVVVYLGDCLQTQVNGIDSSGNRGVASLPFLTRSQSSLRADICRSMIVWAVSSALTISCLESSMKKCRHHRSAPPCA